MCASESCGSSHNTGSGIYKDMNRALFLCCSKINPPFRNPRSLPGIAEAIPFLEKRKVSACPERSAEVPLELCRRIRILEEAERLSTLLRKNQAQAFLEKWK